MSVFAVSVLQPKSWWDSPLAGGGRSTSQFSTSTLKSGRCSQQLLQGKADKLWSHIFANTFLQMEKKNLLYFKIRGKSGRAEDKAKDAALKGKVCK